MGNKGEWESLRAEEKRGGVRERNMMSIE